MSIIHCEYCGDKIDSDDDPDCFVEVPWLNLADKVWCESCREEQWDKHERNYMDEEDRLVEERGEQISDERRALDEDYNPFTKEK